MDYLGGAEYEAARQLLGLSKRTWSHGDEEIRQRLGAQLIRASMYPPARISRIGNLRKWHNHSWRCRPKQWAGVGEESLCDGEGIVCCDGIDKRCGRRENTIL